MEKKKANDSVNSFEFYLDMYFKILQDRMVFKIHPELVEVFMYYKKILRNSTYQFYNGCNNFFEMPIWIDTKDKQYYLYWSIDMIDKYIDLNLNKIVDLSVNKEKIYSCKSRLNFNKLNYYKTINKFERPIVLAYHKPINTWLVIDGNHRYHAAKCRKDNLIKAIYLDPNIHWNFLINDLSRIQYLIHHNLYLLNKYSINPLKINIISSKDLNEFGFIDFINKPVNFSKQKNIKLYLYQRIKMLFKFIEIYKK